MSPTTLVTFRIRAPAYTRSLQLYGSWDNFTTGYTMSKDLQARSEYWSGCFNFTNIICDGEPAEVIRSRDGGLKMGGTYWYYYKVDNVTDLHNVCERATTTCPLLPGQLVNVLNVPYAFSGNRSRDASTSSSSSERRTMNPNDRFENPRPAPAKPEPSRLSTSPTTMQSDGFEQPISKIETPNANKFIRLPHKASVDSTSGLLPGGIRAAFKLRTARSKSPEVKSVSRVPDHRRAVSTERRASPDARGLPEERYRPRARGLLLRSASDESIQTLSFETHRRRRSPPGEARLPGMIGPACRPVQPLTLVHSNCAPMEIVTENVSRGNTPAEGLVIQEKYTRIQPDLEKRLPTLPNTPSSAYPASLNNNSPRRGMPLDIEQLDSHFSATTIATEFQPLSMAFAEQSRFSEWIPAADTTPSSVLVDSSMPFPDDYGRSWSSDNGFSDEHHDGGAFLPSLDSFSSISSNISTAPSISFGDQDSDFGSSLFTGAKGVQESACKRMPQYSLPEDSYTSQTTLKPVVEESVHSANFRTDNKTINQIRESQDDGIMHSESMRQLLEELSYLGGMIQQ